MTSLDVLEEVVDRVNRRELLLARDDRVERLHDGTRPLAQLEAVASFGHAEHLGDDDEGEREREAGDEIELGCVLRVVEVAVDERLDARPQLLDRAGREDLRHEPAQPVVVGRVEVQHRAVAAVAALVEQRLNFRVGVSFEQPRAGGDVPRR